jgi:acetyl-CoA acetyltransferase
LDIVISGIGETEYVRGTTKTAKQLLIQAAAAACADAGIDGSAIDGIVCSYGGSVEDLIAGLGIADLKFHASLHIGGATPVASVGLAADIVASGRATRVLVPIALKQFSGRLRLSDPNGGAMTNAMENRMPLSDLRIHIEYPSGLSTPMQWYSLHANRWLYETKADLEGFKTVALNTRRHAHNNDQAYFRDRALTEEMYDASPFLTRPFRLYDICLESDGGAAVVVEAASTDQSGRERKVYIAGGGEGHPESPDDLAGRLSALDLGISKAAGRVFSEAGVRTDDFDFAEIYDCFSFIVLRQLEEMKFCERGQAGAFVRDKGIGPGGSFPINTHGGLLSQAHLVGMNHVVEAVRQLRGDAGPAQVPNARLGLVTGYGDLGDGSLLVLRN